MLNRQFINCPADSLFRREEITLGLLDISDWQRTTAESLATQTRKWEPVGKQ